MQKPVSHNIFNLIKQIEKDNIVIAGIILKPQLLDEQPGKRHFTSQIIINTNNSDGIDLQDLDCIPLEKDEVLIRAIQSIKTQETTLFLFSDDKRLYSNIILALPKLDKTFISDTKGKIDIGSFKINSLDNLDVMISTNI